MKKEVAIYDPQSFAISQVDTNELKALIRENFGIEGLKASDFPRIKVPAGGGRVWTIPTLDEEKDAKELDGIVIHTQLTRAYWEEDYSGGNAPPDCFSPDCVTGTGTPGGMCDSCQFAEWGSAKNDGNGQACKQRRLVFIIRDDSILPYVLSIPATSLKSFREYMVKLLGAGKRMYTVITRFTLEKDKNDSGIEYSKVVPSMLEPVSDIATIEAYVKAIKPYIETSVRDIASEQMEEQVDVAVGEV